MLKGVVLSTISMHYILSKLFSMLKRRFVSLIAKKVCWKWLACSGFRLVVWRKDRGCALPD